MTEPTKDLIPVQSKKLVQSALDFCASITEIVITNDDEYKNNGEMIKKLSLFIKSIEKDRKELLKPIRAEQDTINDYFKKVQIPLKNWDRKLRDALEKYDDDKRKERIEAQKRADEKAEKERLRLEAEAKKKTEKSQKAAEEGNIEKAQEYHEQAQTTTQLAETIESPDIAVETPKVEGLHYRDNWTAEVIDKKQFIKHCLITNNLALVNIDISQLNKIAQAAKGKISFPGIKLHNKRTTVTRY